jgi:hypothetical protein
MSRAVALCLMFVFVPFTRADGIDTRAVAKANSFLNTSKRFEFVNGFVHFGTKYLGHCYVKTLTVQDGSGRPVPGHFALVYDYRWSDGGETQLAFLCDARGHVYKTQVLADNGILQKPFAVANLSITIVGEALYEAPKDSLTEGDRRLLRTLVNAADAQGLLHLALRIQQASD